MNEFVCSTILSVTNSIAFICQWIEESVSIAFHEGKQLFNEHVNGESIEEKESWTKWTYDTLFKPSVESEWFQSIIYLVLGVADLWRTEYSRCLVALHDFYQESLAKLFEDLLVPLWLILLLLVVLLPLHLWNIFTTLKVKRSAKMKALLSKSKTFQLHPILTEAYSLAKTAFIEENRERLRSIVENHDLNINTFYLSGEPSLFLSACLSGDRQCVRYMLKKGGDTGSTTKEGYSALYLATYGILNSPSTGTWILKDLKERGANVNAQTRTGYTALHRAAFNGNTKVIQTLLDIGADPYITNNMGLYPLDSAVNAGHVEAAKLLQINLENPYLWDIVEPHTPPAIRQGLQSPYKKHLVESNMPPSALKRRTQMLARPEQ